MKRKITSLVLFVSCFYLSALGKQPIQLSSPNGQIKVEIILSDKLYYSIKYEDDALLSSNHVLLQLDTETLGESPVLSSIHHTSVNEKHTPIVPLKFSAVSNHYNQVLMKFRGRYSIEFRAFDDGVAYRFLTDKKGEITVLNEEFALRFPTDYTLHLQQPNGFKTAYEELYTSVESTKWNENDRMAVLPALIDTKKGYKILVSESDLSDYPCMFLRGDGQNGVRSAFPKAPLEFGEDGDRSVKILKEASYIAKTEGKRSFPWRYMVIVKQDGQLIENTMTYRLSTKNTFKDADWIKPGQASWEWWNGAKLYGPDVNFVSGFNMETYKYFIDFASKYGIPYIIMDEGWAKGTRDPFTPNSQVDVHEIIRYGKEKDVDVFLWLTWLTVENNMDVFEKFAEWGVKGVKIDFMDRSDQWMVNYYERVAKEAGKHKLLVDFHGSFKPAGLEYKYPNVISYEGVRGMEQMGGCYPDNSIYFPFIRNAVGAMDYTPGAMISMQPQAYSAKRPNSASIGTRAYQMALFVIFESGIQMLADNPTLYYRNPDCTEFITQVPTTWDETRSLDSKFGEYAIVAKRKGNKWFIGGMTNSKEKWREFDLQLDFLKDGQQYKITQFYDGINAPEQAMDYRREEATVLKGEQLKIRIARNGGYAAVIEVE